MPVVFQPADPYSTAIASGYGATEQWNKEYPTMAGLAESIGRNNLQLQLQSQQIAHQNALASAQISARSQEQSTAEQTSAEMQRRQQAGQQQIQQQMADAHERSQFVSAMLEGQQVSQHEMLVMNRQQQALNDYVSQVGQGNIDPSEVAEMALQLKTGINMTQQRLKKQQADDYEAQAGLRSQQTANLAKDNANMEQFEAERIKEGYGTLHFHDNSGRMHVMLQNKKTGEWYNPLLEHNKNADEAEAKRADAALKIWDTQIKHWNDEYRQEQKRVEDNMHKLEKREGSIPADELDSKVRDNLEKRGVRYPGDAPAGAKPKIGQPEMGGGDYPAPRGGSMVENLQSSVVDKMKGDPYAMAVAQGHLNVLKEIQQKYPNLPAAPADVQQKYHSAKYALRLLSEQLKNSE